MTENKSIVQRCMDGFNKADHGQILSCLTDDVIWEMPGFFQRVGKEAFGKELENKAFEGHPVVSVTRIIEEGNVVIAEGSVTGDDGITRVFCDVCELRDGKISKLIAYIAEQK